MPSPPSVLPRPCLLEAGQLPLLELAELAAREGHRPRPIYTGHKWFARRLGSVFRALLVGAGVEPAVDFWPQYYGYFDLRNAIVLDPFVGGGTSIVEATRLGATAHAVDIDPVACAVSRFQVSAAQLPDLRPALKALAATVGRKVRRFHVTTTPDDIQRTVLHHFWVQTVRCGHCEHVFDAHSNYVLGYQERTRWVFCSRCGDVGSSPASSQSFQCRACKARTQVAKGTTVRGVARCPSCRKERPLIDIARSSDGPPQWRLFALEVLGKPEGERAVPNAYRRFIKASPDDMALYDAAAAELEHHTRHLPDDDAISLPRTDPRLTDYGYRNWTDLFNARQLLHLSLLAQAIDKYDGPERYALSVAFSSHLTTNCMMAAYTAKWRRLTPLFSIRAFRHIQRPVEINPWCDGTGRGTFPNTVRKIMRAADFAHAPRELALGGGFRPVKAIAPKQPPNVVCGSARNLGFLNAGSVDLVLTDPPYYDNISYYELAEFFVPWMHRIGLLNPSNGREKISIESLVANRHDTDSVADYAENIGAAFAEIQRVLKDNGLLVFSFRHSLPQAWQALAEGLARTRLTATAFFPVPGEAGSSLQAHSGTALWDAIFVLRKTPGTDFALPRPLALTADQVSGVQNRVAAWSKELAHANVPFKPADQRVIARAGLVSQALSGAGGGAIPLTDALAGPGSV